MLSASTYSTQVENHIFLPLMEFDPKDLVFKPLLVTGTPERSEISTGPMKGGVSFSFEIRPEACWSDGKPVTAEDYLFTLKAAVNPHTLANTWRSFLMNIDSVIIDPQDNKKFRVAFKESYMLARTSAANFNIYPKHFYDPKGRMDRYSLTALKRDSVGGSAVHFANEFGAEDYSQRRIMGSGPYRLTFWDAQKSMLLEKNDDWWGKEKGLLESNPSTIKYLFIPDETTAITLLKDGQLDIISAVSPTTFADLKEGRDNRRLKFYTPAILQYYYLALNNRDPRLSDKRVRKALAHTLNLSHLAEVLMAGLAQPVASPIHPSKSYFNKDLNPVPFDLESAAELLGEAGWSDSDEDGIVDKEIDGISTPLELTILVTSKELGKNIARIFKENASKVGVKINIESKEWGFIRGKLGARSFQVVAMATRQSPDMTDMYQSWHTTSMGPGGRNIVGFGNEQTDAIIEEIRTTQIEERRYALYNEIQEMIYEEQPMIFLFAPTETVITSDRISLVTSSRRPGYFENTAKMN